MLFGFDEFVAFVGFDVDVVVVDDDVVDVIPCALRRFIKHQC